MHGDRSKAAIARIEAALARIEAAAARPPAPSGPAPSGDADLDKLRDKHDRLRAAVQDSLEQLELLIEGAQG
jgi:hypothetical protein